MWPEGSLSALPESTGQDHAGDRNSVDRADDVCERLASCRVCDSVRLETVVDLGEQHLTGVFLEAGLEVAKGPLQLVRCKSCGLVQLGHTYDLSMMYGDTYGYRSGLNQSMIRHLGSIVSQIRDRVDLRPNDTVIDIGSNDGTLLGCYPDNLRRIGVDPTIEKFGEYYAEGIEKLPEFFTADAVRCFAGEYVKAKVITSIACFYDLERPKEFVRDVASLLADDGIWVFEQAYLPEMLRRNAYDSICHEHLEYYTLSDIYTLLKDGGLEMLSVEFDDTNGGSFRVMAGHNLEHRSTKDEATIADALIGEIKPSTEPFQPFRRAIDRETTLLLTFLKHIQEERKLVIGYGASTKGNVLLQYCGITPDLLPFIAEVNEDKFGCVTPGTNIPIISEADARRMGPDYYLVLPWHFKEGIIQKEQDFLRDGGKLIFPLPEVEVIG